MSARGGACCSRLGPRIQRCSLLAVAAMALPTCQEPYEFLCRMPRDKLAVAARTRARGTGRGKWGQNFSL